MAMPPEDRSPYDRLLTDACVGPDDGAIDRGVLFDPALAADHAVWPDAGPGLDDGTRVDEAGAFHDDTFFDARLGRDPGGGRLPGEARGAVPSVHDVAMHLHVLFRGADV